MQSWDQSENSATATATDTHPIHILLVEDDMTLGKAVARGLEDGGKNCTWVRSATRGLEVLRTDQFSAVILDLMLPDMSGIQMLQAMRKEGNHVPVLILTAMGSVQDRVDGLEGGADDYMVKPFAFPELLARLKAITRRTQKIVTQHLRVGPVSLDLSTRRFFRDGREVDLTPTESGLLEFLMRHSDQVVTRKMLCEHLWESDWEGVTNVIEVHINRLRSKMDRDFEKQLIQTVRGRGYVLRIS